MVVARQFTYNRSRSSAVHRQTNIRATHPARTGLRRWTLGNGHLEFVHKACTIAWDIRAAHGVTIHHD